MNSRKTSKRKNAIKGILLFTGLSLLPVALLFAGQVPHAQLQTPQEIQQERIERSVETWRGMEKEVKGILKKANKLPTYKAIK